MRNEFVSPIDPSHNQSLTQDSHDRRNDFARDPVPPVGCGGPWNGTVSLDWRTTPLKPWWLTLAIALISSAVVLIVGLGILATYTGYVIGQFKLRYPHVHSMADAGEVMMGAFGRELLGTAQVVFLVFIMGSHILTFMVMMNTVTEHGTCSIVFGVVGLVLSFVLTLPRTLKKVSWMSISCRSWQFGERSSPRGFILIGSCSIH